MTESTFPREEAAEKDGTNMHKNTFLKTKEGYRSEVQASAIIAARCNGSHTIIGLRGSGTNIIRLQGHHCSARRMTTVYVMSPPMKARQFWMTDRGSGFSCLNPKV